MSNSETSHIAARIGFSWSWKRREARVAVLAGDVLRIERISCPAVSDMIDGFREAMKLIGPAKGFDLVLFDEFDDPGYWELFDERQADLENEAQAHGMRTCERPQRIDTNPLLSDLAFVITAMRRRPMSGVVCAIRKSDTVEFCAPSPRSSRIPVVSKPTRDWQSPDAIAETIRDVQSRLDIDTECSTWIVAGAGCGIVARGLAGLAHVQEVVVLAHAGASTPVGLLVMDLIREHRISFGYAPGLGMGDTARLRQTFRDLMDQASAEAFRLGFDTDDLVCDKFVEIGVLGSDSGTFWTLSCPEFSTVHQIFQQFDQLSRVTAGREFANKVIVGATVRSTIETPKPRLLGVAISSTIAGAGEPATRVTVGPGKMDACLCEIDVPPGWRAEWEPSGDIVMTRV